MTRAELDLARGRLDAAEAADRAILDECRARLGPDDRLTIAAGLALARVREARGDRDAAAPLYRAALESARKNPTDRETLAAALTESGRSRLGAGDPTAAEALLREALAIREAEKPQHWQTAEVRSLLGGALLGQKKAAEAAPLLRSGLRGDGPVGRRDPAGRPAPAGRGARPPDRGRRGGRDEGRARGVEGRAGEARRRGTEVISPTTGARSPAPPDASLDPLGTDPAIRRVSSDWIPARRGARTSVRNRATFQRHAGQCLSTHQPRLLD